MALTSIIQVLKVNEKRTGTKNGRDWAMQDCECALLLETGELEQVGVLQLPKDMMGDTAPKPGTYLGSFALRAGMQDRQIKAVLVSLQPYTVGRPSASKAAAA
jgi:hypothetical protein